VERYRNLLRGEHYRVGRVDEGLEVVARLLPRGPIRPEDLESRSKALAELKRLGVQLACEEETWLVAMLTKEIDLGLLRAPLEALVGSI
jgi:hypothetical protein